MIVQGTPTNERLGDPAESAVETSAAGSSSLSAEDWLKAAIALLLDEGIDQVKIQRLSKRLGVSRGSFYWHYRDREELLGAILQRWQENNTDALISALGTADRPLEERVLALFTLWLDQHPFYPRFDNAVRSWATKSEKARAVQRAADRQRMEHLEAMFRDAGYPAAEAKVRADVFYFTQVGYYSLDLEESKAQRLAKVELYFRAFTGRQLPDSVAADYRRRQTARMAG